jgi:hypothetical protein
MTDPGYPLSLMTRNPLSLMTLRVNGVILSLPEKDRLRM